MEKEKSIETKQLMIKGNIMSWEEMMIQLSNVSCVSVSELNTIQFPLLALVFVIVGIALIQAEPTLGIAGLGVGLGWIVWWANANEKRKSSKKLNILVNSGHTFQIVFSDRNFLKKILEILEVIIREGGIGNNSISINVKDCKIDGDARILNDLKMNK